MDKCLDKLPKDIVELIFQYAGTPANQDMVNVVKSNSFRRQRKKLLMCWRYLPYSLSHLLGLDEHMIKHVVERNKPKHQEIMYIRNFVEHYKPFNYLRGDYLLTNMAPDEETCKPQKGRPPKVKDIMLCVPRHPTLNWLLAFRF